MTFFFYFFRHSGGRYGPRRCIFLPEISATTVAHDEPVRAVLASDGLWDVLSVAQVAEILSVNFDPEKAAAQLTSTALKLRKKNKLRLDDISVIVIDINSQENAGSTKSNSEGVEPGEILGRKYGSYLKLQTPSCQLSVETVSSMESSNCGE